MNGLSSIWPPSRTAINGISLGDAWPCQAIPARTEQWESILPFHKLTQWLTYSLMQPMQSLLNMHFAGTELLTGLPEYRNGGLFIDLGILTLKRDDLERGLENYSDYCRRTETKAVEVAPMFEPGDDVVVEWRGVTIGLLDKLCMEVNKALKKELAGNEMTLAQLLEAGSWKVCGKDSSISGLHSPNILTGRPRGCGDSPTKHKGTSDPYRQRWHSVLIMADATRAVLRPCLNTQRDESRITTGKRMKIVTYSTFGELTNGRISNTLSYRGGDEKPGMWRTGSTNG
jgi:hypothetical protein